jgi:gamma-glutamyltranspeptidase / glutathione hydrolase
MIPKSGHRFSEKIMLKRKIQPPTGAMPNLKNLPRRFWFLTITCALFFPAVAPAQDGEIPAAQGVLAQNGMVVAQEARAARIGNDILQKGGNAVDAAVAVGFALAVTYPRAGNLGGGGFMVIHRANGDDTTIDYRETAPRGINAKSFLDAQGNADPQKSRDSALAIGVPGTVAGLALAEEKYGSGRFTLADLIAPAIEMAHNGFAFADDRAEALPNERARLVRWPSTVKIFFKADGSPVSSGDRLVQGDLAETLGAIAR